MNRYRYERPGALAIDASAYGREFSASAWGAGVATSENTPPPFEHCGATAVVTIRGPLTHHQDWVCDNYDSIKNRCAAAFASTAARVALKIDSPGGDTSGVFETSRELRAMAAAAQKPLCAYTNGTMTSAAFVLACAADTIIVSHEGLLGSIGVISGIMSLTEANKRAGVEFEIITSGARKADGNPNVPITDGARAALQANVDGLAELFFELVSERRNIGVDAARGLQAAMFIGQKAVDVGLADGVATWSEFLAMVASGGIGGGAAKENIRVDYKQLVEALRAAAEGDDEEQAKKAKAALVAMGEEEPDGDEEKKDEKAEKAEGDEQKVEGEGVDKKDEDEKASSKASAKVAASTKAAVNVASDFEGLRASVERLQVSTMLDKRPDLAASTRAWLDTQPADVVTSFLAKAAKPSAPRNEKASQGRAGAALLEGQEREALDAGMGIRPASASAPERRQDGSFVLHTMRPSQARSTAQKGQ